MATRRDFLTGAAVAAGAVMTGFPAIIGSANAAEPLTFVTPFGFIADFIEIMNAASGGHFAKQGLDVKVVGANGTAQAMQQLVAGQAQFGRSAPIDQIRAVSTLKAPLTAVMTLDQASTFQIVSTKDKPILKAEDLKGKTIGVVSVAGSTDTFLDLILAAVGLKKDDVKREVTGNNPGAIEFIKQGRIDCFMCSLAVVVAIQQSGQAIEYWGTDKYAPMPGQVYTTTHDIIATKPDLVTRVLRAMKASIDECMTQPLGPIFQRAAKDYDIPNMKKLDELIAVEKAAIDQLWLAEGKENLLRNVPHRWESAVTSLRSAGIADIKDPTSLYTNKFIDAVLKS